MVLDKADPNARSVGSFFMNPVMSRELFDELHSKMSAEESLIPSFPGGANNVKIPAAWLVEHSGFRKGFRKGGVGISANHALALVNYGGTTKELLGLAEEIREAVKRKFSIMLQTEPSIVS
jgi:UDP-N-acetylmuramate dehydrogenase